jgi:hypothetical protein
MKKRNKRKPRTQQWKKNQSKVTEVQRKKDVEKKKKKQKEKLVRKKKIESENINLSEEEEEVEYFDSNKTVDYGQSTKKSIMRKINKRKPRTQKWEYNQNKVTEVKTEEKLVRKKKIESENINLSEEEEIEVEYF